jgi:hypothetical protein
MFELRNLAKAMMNDCWQSFLFDSSLSDDVARRARVSHAEPPGAWAPNSADFSVRFPALEGLLRQAFVSHVRLGHDEFRLFSWRLRDGVFSGWLSPLPSNRNNPALHPDHMILLESFGGIKEYANSPDNSWGSESIQRAYRT